jgi:cytidylate kinase
MIIAIDGSAASGKGTLARNLAHAFHLAHLDTGLLYRAVGLKLLSQDKSLHDEETAIEVAQSLTFQDLRDPDLRGDFAAQAASQIAIIPGVRAALLDFQRNFAKHPPQPYQGVVLDGRDIGTIILPDADFKFFVTAQLEIRSNRRVQELASRDLPADYETVYADMLARDQRDQERAIAPALPAKDAIIIDTSYLNPQEVLEIASQIILEKMKLSGQNNSIKPIL